MARAMPKAASGLLSYFTRHRTAANLLLVVLVVLGVAAMPNMRAQFFPDVIVEEVNIRVAWEGAGPEDVDSAIVQVLEPVLLAVEGVDGSSSTSREGSAQIRLEFEPGYDMSRATDDVRAAVDGVTTLPDEADEPVIRQSAWRDQVTDIVITGPLDTLQLAQLADELKLYYARTTKGTPWARKRKINEEMV